MPAGDVSKREADTDTVADANLRDLPLAGQCCTIRTPMPLRLCARAVYAGLLLELTERRLAGRIRLFTSKAALADQRDRAVDAARLLWALQQPFESATRAPTLG